MTTIGDVKLGEALGRGAFGTVYKGWNKETSKTVAVKRLDVSEMPAEELAGVKRELKVLKALDHCNIIKCYGAVRTKKHINLIMEYAEGGSLEHLLMRFGTLQEPLISRYLRSTLLALDYLHGEHVVHRDIKAGNILMTKTGDVKVADFGIATTMSNLSDSKANSGNAGGGTSNSSSAGGVSGSPFWMAPEIIEMEPATSAADIWSLGCTIIELLTGTPPYFDLNGMQAMWAMVENEHPPFPDGLSTELTDFLQRCFRRVPADRPTARDLLSHAFIVKYATDSVPDYYSSSSSSSTASSSSSSSVRFDDAAIAASQVQSSKPALERVDTVQSVQRLLKTAMAGAAEQTSSGIEADRLAQNIEDKLALLVELKAKEKGFGQALEVARSRLARAESQYAVLLKQIDSARSEMRAMCVNLAQSTDVSIDELWASKEQQLSKKSDGASSQQKSTEEMVQAIIAPTPRGERHASGSGLKRASASSGIVSRGRALSDVDKARAIAPPSEPAPHVPSPLAAPSSSNKHRRTRSTGGPASVDIIVDNNGDRRHNKIQGAISQWSATTSEVVADSSNDDEYDDNGTRRGHGVHQRRIRKHAKKSKKKK
jgi:serine/threonine protein kinase